MRVKRGFATRHRRRKVLKAARGFVGGRHRLIRPARIVLMKSLQYAYRDRRVRKRLMRQLWNVRVGNAARELNTSYSKLMGGLHAKNVAVNRKMLSEIAVSYPKDFEQIVQFALQ